MAIKKTDNYADFRYKIASEAELAEALWQIEQGDYRDLEDYIDCHTRSEKRRMQQQATTGKTEQTQSGKTKRLTTAKKDKAA